MEVLINQKAVERGEKLGKFLSIAGLAILAGGLIASFNEKYLLISMLALVAGFVVSQIGSYHVFRWGRRPRVDEELDKALKGLNSDFKMYHYFLPADHVLVGPTGVFVFVAKPQDGEIRCEGRRWRQKMTARRIFLFFGQEGLGNPPAELELGMKGVAQLINERRPDLDQVVIRGAVVFTNPRARLLINDPVVPALLPKQLKTFVRKPSEKHGFLKGEERRGVIDVFDAVVREKMPMAETAPAE